MTLDDDCIIGYNTKGTATIESTLDANHYDVTLGQNKTGNGQLTVDGGGAKLDDIASLLVGVDGKGTALIENGGQMFASTLWDGSSSSSHQGTGKITVSGGGSGLGVAHKAYVGEHASGSLTVQKDGGVAIGSYLGVGAKGLLTVTSDSEIRVGTVVSAPTPGSVTIGAGAAVWLSCAGGAYNANTVISGGGLHIEQSSAIAATKDISFKGAGTLTLSSEVTLGNAISGFGKGDTINLLGVAAETDRYDPSYGTLTLENGTFPVDTLLIKGNYTTSNFPLAEKAGNAVVTFKPSKGSAASAQEQISNSALLSNSPGYHAAEAVGGRGSATPDLWSVGHASGG